MKAPDCGVHHDVPFDVYQSWEVAASASQLNLFANSPAHYKFGYKPPTKAMDIGTVIHSVVLEGTIDSYAVVPEYHLEDGNVDSKGKPSQSKATTWYKDKVKTFALAHSDQAIISQETYDAKGVLKAIQDHPSARDLLTGGEPEVSMVWRDETTGLLCKGRVDMLHDKRFVDLKTTASCTSFNIGAYGYHRQMAFYMQGLKAITGQSYTPYIVACEKAPPYGVMAAALSLHAMVTGHEECLDLLEQLSGCIFTDDWPCYEDPIEWGLE